MLTTNPEIWKNKKNNGQDYIKSENDIKETNEEDGDEEILDENISELKDKQLKKYTSQKYECNQVSANMANNQNENSKDLFNKINNNGTTSPTNNILNGNNNVYYGQNMINMSAMNYMIPNYPINEELANNNYISVINPQMMNIPGFIGTQMTLNNSMKLNNNMNLNMQNRQVNMNIPIQAINNGYMLKQQPKSKYNMYKDGNMNDNNQNQQLNQYLMNNNMQNKMYQNNNNNNNNNINNSNYNNSNNNSCNNNKNNKNNKNEKENKKIIIENIIIGQEKRTTLMLRNIPNKYTLNNIVEEIDSSFWGKYDYINLPIDYERKLNLGYAFINFVDPLHIILFYETYHDKKWMKYKSVKKMDMTYADKQGKKDINCKDEQTYFAVEDKKINFNSLRPKIQIPMKYHDFFKKIYPSSVCIVEDKYSIYQDKCFWVKYMKK